MAKRIQHERLKVRRPCIAHLRDMINYKQLKRHQFLYWACPPDMGKLPPYVASAIVLDGYEKGNFDLVIIAVGDKKYITNPGLIQVWLIEFKFGAGTYTAEQKAIAQVVEPLAAPIKCLKIYSPDEFRDFVTINLK